MGSEIIGDLEITVIAMEFTLLILVIGGWIAFKSERGLEQTILLSDRYKIGIIFVVIMAIMVLCGTVCDGKSENANDIFYDVGQYLLPSLALSVLGFYIYKGIIVFFHEVKNTDS